LTQSQKEAIQQVMGRERHNMEPLFEQLRSVRQKLLALDVQHSNKRDIKTLADAQAFVGEIHRGQRAYAV